MDRELSYLIPLKQFAEGWINGTQKWIQLYPYDSWDHPFYGTTTITPAEAQKFVENFNNKVRGTEIHSDYEHGEDAAKGSKASGKFVKVVAANAGDTLDGDYSVTSGGPYALVEFTEEAKKEIDAGEWNYWSTSHWDTWTHPHTHEQHEFVLDGGGLTNKPFVKGMVPLNFSELMLADPELKMHAVLSGADKNDLPDSAFAYIEPGGKKDSEGKTVPRSKRHLPYKNAQGQIDLPHVRNALARLSHTQIPESVKGGIRAMLQRHLAAQHSEVAERVLNNLENIPENQFIVDDDGDMSEEWIRKQFGLPTNTDEEGMDELLKKFRELFGLAEDASDEDVLKHASEMKDANSAMETELEPLRELQKNSEKKKSFAERFPEEAQELDEMRAYRREQESKKFTESLAAKRVTRKVGDGDDVLEQPTGLGLSALAVENAGEVVKKFSEGTVTVDDFRQFTESLYDNGIVDYGTHGSSREDETDPETGKLNKNQTPQETRKMFSERIHKLADDEFEGDLRKAYVEAQERWPEEFDIYKNNKPVAAQ